MVASRRSSSRWAKPTIGSSGVLRRFAWRRCFMAQLGAHGRARGRRPCRQELAEAAHAPYDIICCRGEVKGWLDQWLLEKSHLASHYRDCVAAKAQSDRRRARHWARRLRLPQEARSSGEGEMIGVESRPAEVVVEERTFSLQMATRRASMARRMSIEKQERRKSSQLQPAKLMKYNRLQRLLAAKQADFDALLPQQKEKISLAFNRAKQEKPALNGQQLRQALQDLKLFGRISHEREAVQEVIRESVASGAVDLLDFALQVIPRVEQRLLETKSPALMALFNKLDAIGTGTLSSSDCIEALRRHADTFVSVLDTDLMEQFWPVFLKELASRRIHKNSDEAVDFLHFQSLAAEMEEKLTYFQSQIEERAAKSANLSPQLEALHFGEIALMMRYYAKHEASGRNLMTPQQLIMALMDSGAMPVVGRLYGSAMSSLTSKSSSRYSFFRFPDFLEQVDLLRKEERTMRTASFKSWYTIHKYQHDHRLPVADMAQVILDLSLVTDSCRNVQDVRVLVEDCCRDDGAQLHMEACIELTSKVVESARAVARRREAMVAEQVNFSQEQVFNLRQFFAQMTLSGVVGPDDLHELLVELLGEVDDSLVQELLDIALPSGYFQNTPKPRAKREESKKSSAAQAEEEAQASRRALEESVLRFDGFLWIMGHLLKPV